MGSPWTPLLLADDVAVLLKVKKSRVYELVRTGSLPAVRMGTQVRFDGAKVLAWIEAGGDTTTTKHTNGSK